MSITQSLIMLISSGIIIALFTVGIFSDSIVLLGLAGILTLIEFSVTAYLAVQVSQRRSDPAEGSSPETWRTYH